MPKPLDLSGQKFGRLTPIEIVGTHSSRAKLWRCRCDCGGETTVEATKLRTGNTRSCGCLVTEHAIRVRPSAVRHGDTQGGKMSAEWRAWRNMRSRCSRPSDVSYARYGGRGIRVCERWLTYENFLADVGRRPSPAHSLDRIDSDGHYEPGNVRWATDQQQAENRGQTTVVTIHGEAMSVSRAARTLGLSKGTVMARLSRGWTPEEALGLCQRASPNALDPPG